MIRIFISMDVEGHGSESSILDLPDSGSQESVIKAMKALMPVMHAECWNKHLAKVKKEANDAPPA